MEEFPARGPESDADTRNDRAALDPDDPRLRAWRNFLYAHAAVMRELEAQLVSERAMTLAEYDALLQLAAAPGARLRMSDLAARVLLSRSGMTRLVDRLETQGLVRREHCGSDARGSFAALTPDGMQRFREAMPVHLRGISQVFTDVVDDETAAVIERAMCDVAVAAGHPVPDLRRASADECVDAPVEATGAAMPGESGLEHSPPGPTAAATV